MHRTFLLRRKPREFIFFPAMIAQPLRKSPESENVITYTQSQSAELVLNVVSIKSFPGGECEEVPEDTILKYYFEHSIAAYKRIVTGTSRFPF